MGRVRAVAWRPSRAVSREIDGSRVRQQALLGCSGRFAGPGPVRVRRPSAAEAGGPGASSHTGTGHVGPITTRPSMPLSASGPAGTWESSTSTQGQGSRAAMPAAAQAMTPSTARGPARAQLRSHRAPDRFHAGGASSRKLRGAGYRTRTGARSLEGFCAAITPIPRGNHLDCTPDGPRGQLRLTTAFGWVPGAREAAEPVNGHRDRTGTSPAACRSRPRTGRTTNGPTCPAGVLMGRAWRLEPA